MNERFIATYIKIVWGSPQARLQVYYYILVRCMYVFHGFPALKFNPPPSPVWLRCHGRMAVSFLVSRRNLERPGQSGCIQDPAEPDKTSWQPWQAFPQPPHPPSERRAVGPVEV